MSESESTPAPDQEPVDQTPTSGPAAGELTADEQNMGMLAHLLGIIGFLGPLIIWLIKKDESTFVDSEGKEALNFQITVLIGYIALIPISMVTCGIGGILYLPLFVIQVLFSILGALKAKDGAAYKYPFAIRLVK